MTSIILEQIDNGRTREYIERRLQMWRDEHPHLDVFLGSWKGKPSIVASDET